MVRGKASRRKSGLRKILILKIIQMATVLFAIEEQRKKFLKENWCARVWGVCAYVFGYVVMERAGVPR